MKWQAKVEQILHQQTQVSTHHVLRSDHNITLGFPRYTFTFKKTTLALRTNKEHKEETRFPLLIDTVSYMQPGRILWWSQRSLQFLGDPSLSRLYLSYHYIPPLKKQSFSPSPGKCFPPLRIYFHCLALFSAFHLSASTPHLHPLLLKKITKRALGNTFLLFQLESWLSITINGDCFFNGKWITIMQRNAMVYRLHICYMALGSPVYFSAGRGSHQKTHSDCCCHQKMFDCLSRQNYPLVPAKSWESLVGVGKHTRKQVPFIPIKQCIAGTW